MSTSAGVERRRALSEEHQRAGSRIRAGEAGSEGELRAEGCSGVEQPRGWVQLGLRVAQLWVMWGTAGKWILGGIRGKTVLVLKGIR